MSDEFESAHMKALKLAALASRGVGGEAEVAQRKLAQHLEAHGLTLEMLSESRRSERMLHCVVDLNKATKDTGLMKLAGQTLGYVLNDSALHYSSRVVKLGRRSCYVVKAELTDLEFEDWTNCFCHYAPLFVASRKNLQSALRACFLGFIHKHKVFAQRPDDADEGKPLTPAQMAALMTAMHSAEGDKWERPSGRLEQGGFMLE